MSVWDVPTPVGREPGWFERSSWAERDWQAALKKYWEARQWHNDPAAQSRADATLRVARADYRRRILGWYNALCLPMQPGHCVPTSVAELLAEEWDEGTAHP